MIWLIFELGKDGKDGKDGGWRTGWKSNQYDDDDHLGIFIIKYFTLKY